VERESERDRQTAVRGSTDGESGIDSGDQNDTDE
jgi:hypothetical protein